MKLSENEKEKIEAWVKDVFGGNNIAYLELIEIIEQFLDKRCCELSRNCSMRVITA